MSDGTRFLDCLRALDGGGAHVESTLFDAPFGVFLEHPVDGCVYANQALLAQFGVAWEEFRGFGWARCVVEEDRVRMRDVLRRFATDLAPVETTYRVLARGGRVRWVQSRLEAVLGSDGRHLGSVGVMFDVTGHRRLRERSAQTQKFDAIGRLATRVAHDFNNLLTAMLASHEFLASEQLSPSGLRSLRTLQDAIEQAAAVTGQLLVLSRRRVSSESVSEIDIALRKLAPLLRRTLGEGVDLVLELNAPEVTVPLDPAQLGQIVLNLATNGRDAMGGYGRLVVRTEESDGGALLEIEDSGCGMDEETMARAFEPFFTTKDAGMGTGLGLASVQDLVSFAGGTLAIESTVDGGTCVTVGLPSLATAAPQASQPAPLTRDLDGAEHVLFVEDQDGLRQSIAYALALHGYRVRTASCIADARVELAKDPAIDALVTDVMLPDGTAVEFVAALRAERPDLPVLFVSGYPGTAAEDLPRSVRRTQFLPKPFSPSTLLAELAVLLH